MITYTDGSRRFNYRVAAAFVDDGHLLVHRAEPDLFWTLPGGRAELMEDAAQTIVREMREELGEDVEVERLLWLVENFFHYDACDYHELLLVWRAHLPAASARRDKDSWFHVADGGTTLTFRWVPLGELDALPLVPAFLRHGVRALPAGVERVVVRERAPADR